jgi:hypothetical protein
MFDCYRSARLRRGRSGGQWPGRDLPFEIEFGHLLLGRKPGPVSLEPWRELGSQQPPKFGAQGRYQAVLIAFKRLKAIPKYRLE